MNTPLEKTKNEYKSQAATIVITYITILAFLSPLLTSFMLLATLSYLILVTGLYYRRSRNVHIKLMTSAIGIDILIVLILQFTRHAVQTAASFSFSPLQQAHIGFSTLATVLYFPVLYLGFKNYFATKVNPRHRLWHLRLGMGAFIFRTLGFILMFSLLSHVKK